MRDKKIEIGKDVNGIVNVQGSTIYQNFNANPISQKDLKYLTSLPPINTNFIGRVKELAKIEENLKSDNVVCIVNGIGGVGKSEISYKYLHEHKEEYKKIAFIEMTEESSTLEELFRIKFQDSLFLTEKDNFDTIIRRLQALPKKNLILLDNMLSDEDLKKIKPLNINFDILISTRIKLDSQNIISLETLDDKDAKELFLSIYKTSKNIDDVLEFLDNHPLFINLTAYSLKEEYIDLYELKDSIVNEEVTKIDSKDDKTFKEHLQKTFNKQFQDEENKELKKLLQVLALFPAIEIEFKILKQILNDEKLKVKLQKLVARGWLNKKENFYKLHQIIRTFILTSYHAEYENITFILENIGNYIDPYDISLIISNLNHYIPIINSLLHIFKDKRDEPMAKILDSNTYFYFSLGEYNNSLKMQKKSLEIRELLYDKKSIFIAKNYNLLGFIYYIKGEYSKAEAFLRKALKIYKKVLGKNHIYTAISYNNLANLYNLQGEYSKAEAFLKRVLKIYKEVLGDNNNYMAISYNSFANLYNLQGKYSKVEPLLRKALKIYKEILEKNHPNIAISYNSLADLYTLQGEYSKAELFYKKALKIYKEVLEENHPYIAISYNSLANLYNLQGKYSEVEPLLRKALKIYKEVLGNNHIYTAMSYNSLADLYNLQGKYSEVEPLLRKALKIYKEILEENHPNIVTSYNSLANLYNLQREYYKAEPLYKKVLKIREDIFGENHPDTARSYNNLANLYHLQGKYSEAEAFLRKALKTYKEVLEENHPDITINYWNLALCYKKQKMYNKSKKLIEKCIKIVDELDYSPINMKILKSELSEIEKNLEKESD